MRRIASRQNTIVARFRAAARGEPDGVMLLDGAHLVLEAVAARVVIQEAAVTAEALESPSGDITRDIVRALEAGAVDVVSVTAPVMAALSPVRSPSPVVALARRPDAAAARPFRPEPPLVVIALDVQDPGNVGAIIRVAEAGGATGVIAAAGSADPFGWKALRGSMGSTLRLPVARAADARAATAMAREHGCRVLATAPRHGQSLFDADFRGPTAVLIGGEGPGLPRDILAAADGLITIPMAPPVESLNAAVTAGLIVYEARRQRYGLSLS